MDNALIGEDRKKRPALGDEAFALIAARFRALSEPMRLKLLRALAGGEMSVSELAEAVGGGQANVSKHLGILMTAGLVARRREGPSTRYRAADPAVFAICDTVCESLGQQLEAQRSAVRSFTAPRARRRAMRPERG